MTPNSRFRTPPPVARRLVASGGSGAAAAAVRRAPSEGAEALPLASADESKTIA